MNIHKLVVSMVAHTPNDHHKGWVSFRISDPSKELASFELEAFEEFFLREELLVAVDSRFSGYSHSTAYQFDEAFGGSSFDLWINKAILPTLRKIGLMIINNNLDRKKCRAWVRELGKQDPIHVLRI